MSDYLPFDHDFIPFNHDLARWIQETQRQVNELRRRELDEYAYGPWQECRLCGLEFSPRHLVDGICEAHR